VSEETLSPSDIKGLLLLFEGFVDEFVALKTLLKEKGVITSDELDRMITRLDAETPRCGFGDSDLSDS
jgi:hypothetical protein